MNENERINAAVKLVYDTLGYVDVKMAAEFANLPTHKVREVVEEHYRKNANDDQYLPKRRTRK